MEVIVKVREYLLYLAIFVCMIKGFLEIIMFVFYLLY